MQRVLLLIDSQAARQRGRITDRDTIHGLTGQPCERPFGKAAHHHETGWALRDMSLDLTVGVSGEPAVEEGR